MLVFESTLTHHGMLRCVLFIVTVIDVLKIKHPELIEYKLYDMIR